MLFAASCRPSCIATPSFSAAAPSLSRRAAVPLSSSLAFAAAPKATLLLRRHLSATSRSSTTTRTMAAASSSSAPVELWVKGDPKTETLLDCPFCHRVLLAAGEKQVPLTLGYVDFAAKPDWLLKVNPQGSVPVAKDLRPSASAENPWVVDSGVICDWLEAEFPSPPSVGTVAAAASAPGGDVFPAFAGFIKAGVGSLEEKEKRAKLDEVVLSLAKAIKDSGKPFLGGDAPQQADFALAPKLHHLSIAAPAHKGWTFPAGSEPVVEYLDRMRSRPSWKQHQYNDESVVAGWKKNVGVDAKK